MAKRQPIHGDVDAFSAAMVPLDDEIIERINTHLDEGRVPAVSVEMAYNEAEAAVRIEEYTMDGVESAAASGYGVRQLAQPAVFQGIWLNRVWDDTGLTLSRKVWNTTQDMKHVVVNEIRDQLARNASWTRTAQAIDNATLLSPDLAGHIDEVVKLGKRAMSGDKTAAKAMERAIRKSQRQIDRLVDVGRRPSRLRAAYNKIIKVAQKGSSEQLQAAVERGQRAKARYYAERVARTEIAKAYHEGFFVRLSQDIDATGWQSSLSARHRIYDICDFHAGADLYGMGNGIYPLNSGPPYPYHPLCTCILSLYYGEDSGAYSPEGGEEFIESRSDEQKKKLLGVGGSKQFEVAPAAWQSHLNNWNGQETKSPRIPPSVFE